MDVLDALSIVLPFAPVVYVAYGTWTYWKDRKEEKIMRKRIKEVCIKNTRNSEDLATFFHPAEAAKSGSVAAKSPSEEPLTPVDIPKGGDLH